MNAQMKWTAWGLGLGVTWVLGCGSADFSGTGDELGVEQSSLGDECLPNTAAGPEMLAEGHAPGLVQEYAVVGDWLYVSGKNFRCNARVQVFDPVGDGPQGDERGLGWLEAGKVRNGRGSRIYYALPRQAFTGVQPSTVRVRVVSKVTDVGIELVSNETTFQFGSASNVPSTSVLVAPQLLFPKSPSLAQPPVVGKKALFAGRGTPGAVLSFRDLETGVVSTHDISANGTWQFRKDIPHAGGLQYIFESYLPTLPSRKEQIVREVFADWTPPAVPAFTLPVAEPGRVPKATVPVLGRVEGTAEAGSRVEVTVLNMKDGKPLGPRCEAAVSAAGRWGCVLSPLTAAAGLYAANAAVTDVAGNVSRASILQVNVVPVPPQKQDL